MSQSGFGITPLCNTANTLVEVSSLLGGSQQSTTVGNLLRNQSQFQDFLESEYGVTPQLAQELLQARINMKAVSGDSARVVIKRLCMAGFLHHHPVSLLSWCQC